MQHTMQKYCAVYRNEESLKKGKNLQELFKQTKSIRIHDSSLVWNTEVVEALVKNLLLQSIASMESAQLEKKVEVLFPIRLQK